MAKTARNIPNFEEDFDTAEFDEETSIPFTLRRQDFVARRIPVGLLKDYQIEAQEASEDGAGIDTILSLFRWMLGPADLETIEEMTKDREHPMKLETLVELTKYLSAEMTGAAGLDEEDLPKEEDSSELPVKAGKASTTNSRGSSKSTPLV